MAPRTFLTAFVVGSLVLSACTRPDDSAAAPSITPADADDDTGIDESSDDSGDGGDTDDTTGSDDSDESTERSTESSDDSPDTTTSTPATSTPTTSTTPTPTTMANTVAPTTNPLDDPSDLTLIFDGVLPFRFGDRDVDIVPALTGLLGDPTIDELREYPDIDQGMYFDASGEERFVAPFGRMVCFAQSLCLQFGAGAPETLIFTGWRVDGPSDLATDDGLRFGSTLADFADLIQFDPSAACYRTAYGQAGGIYVTLLSAEENFTTPDEDGTGLVVGEPDPSQVTVTAMQAGHLPVFVLRDC
ncbi:MAG: hypothetical protein R8G01_13565 [Ilumatobacteraceae bacterium]|nr:hypothetical protein [Ilumatobacteraceae bacterium]